MNLIKNAKNQFLFLKKFKNTESAHLWTENSAKASRVLRFKALRPASRPRASGQQHLARPLATTDHEKYYATTILPPLALLPPPTQSFTPQPSA